MPPVKKATDEEVGEEWEPDAAGFFGDFGGSDDGPSKRKKARDAANREARSGKTLEQEAMDPAVSATEARKKIAAIVRARAGLAPTPGDAAGVDNSHKGKVEAKFERKAERKELEAANAIKFKKVIGKKEAASKAKDHRRQHGRRR